MTIIPASMTKWVLMTRRVIHFQRPCSAATLVPAGEEALARGSIGTKIKECRTCRGRCHSAESQLQMEESTRPMPMRAMLPVVMEDTCDAHLAF